MSSRGILVHSLDDARAALRAASLLGVPVTLHSAPGAAGYGGVAWFERLIAAAVAEFPTVTASAVLDCGDAAGHVMAAIRWLAEPGRTRLSLYFSGDADTAGRLADMCRKAGVALLIDVAPGLDMRGARDPVEACREWLAGRPAAAV